MRMYASVMMMMMMMMIIIIIIIIIDRCVPRDHSFLNLTLETMKCFVGLLEERDHY